MKGAERRATVSEGDNPWAKGLGGEAAPSVEMEREEGDAKSRMRGMEAGYAIGSGRPAPRGGTASTAEPGMDSSSPAPDP